MHRAQWFSNLWIYLALLISFQEQNQDNALLIKICHPIANLMWWNQPCFIHACEQTRQVSLKHWKQSNVSSLRMERISNILQPHCVFLRTLLLYIYISSSSWFNVSPCSAFISCVLVCYHQRPKVKFFFLNIRLLLDASIFSIKLRKFWVALALLHVFMICQDNVFSSSFFLLGSEGVW